MTAILASDIVRALEAANRGLKARAEKSEKVARSLERRIAGLEIEIVALKSAVSLPATAKLPFGLTVSENAIFTLLMSRAIVSKIAARIVLYSARPDDEPADNITNIFMATLCRKLGALNFKIETRRGAGWLIAPETKTRIRNLLNQGVGHDRNVGRERVHPATAPSSDQPAIAS